MMTELITKIKSKEDKPENWLVGEPLPVEQGDCGSVTEEEARNNLGVIEQATSLVYPKKNYKLNLSPEIAEQYQRDMEVLTQEVDQLSIVKDDTEEFVDAAMTTTAAIANEPFRPRNRAERRAAEKATKRQKQKRKKMYIDSIKEASEKLAYINMIEKVRELNEKIKEEGVIENEAND